MSKRAFCFSLLPREDGPTMDLPPVASALADRDDCQVHVLECTNSGKADPPPGDGRLIVHNLGDLVATELAGLPRHGGDEPALVLGELILEAFLTLQADHRFVLAHFSDCATAMRLIEAKRYGVFPHAAPAIAVELGKPSFWLGAQRLRGATGARDLKLDHCERYAFEHADVRIAADAAVLRSARELEWPLGNVLTEPPDADRLVALASSVPSGRRAFAPPASVTVVVSHFNHARFLPGALASLAAQTRPPDEVIVIDDGSTSDDARRVFAEQETTFPGWRFLRQRNGGPGQVRNVGLELARGTYLLPFDSDNLAAPTMIERLLGAMECGSSPAALACHNLSFVDDSDIDASGFVGRYSPTGGPRVLGCVENVYGDSTSIFNSEILRAVGGFEAERWSATEDWQTFVKLVGNGYEVDVLPLPLFYYRTNSGGRLEQAAADPTIKGRLLAHLVERFFLDAPISRLERRQLWESLQAYDHFAAVETQSLLAEQRHWHDQEMAALHRFREEQLAEQRGGRRSARLRRWMRSRLSRGAVGARPAPRGH